MSKGSMKILGIRIIFIVILIGIFFEIKPYYHRYRVKKELYKVHTVINTNDDSFKSLELINEDLEKNNIFFTGEHHGSIKSIEMNLYLLKYFVERAGVSYILYEGGYATAQYLNEYLNTGDELILEDLFYKLSGTMSYTMENYNLLKKIYEYNLELEEDKKLLFVGIDKENPSIAIKYIESLLPEKETDNSQVKDIISSINGLTKVNYIDTSKEVLELISKSRKENEKYFGKNFFHIEYLLKNLSLSKGQLYREELLISNFIELYEYLPKGKYFGQFGGSHTNLHTATKSLASYLQNKYEQTKGKVISIEYSYNNSYSYIPQGLNVDSKIPKDIDDKFFYKDNSTILIKLNQENSIYYEKDIYLNPNSPAIECYQYMMLFSDSQAANKYYRE